MSNIPIIQGVAVSADPSNKYGGYHDSSPYGGYQTTGVGAAVPAYGGNNQDYLVGPPPTDQELRALRQNPLKKYQDVGWAVAFWMHMFFMLGYLALQMQNVQQNNNAGGGGGSSGIYFIVGMTGVAAVLLSTAALTFMMRQAEKLVQTALIFSVGCSLVVGVLGFMSGSLLMGILGLLSFAVGICYAHAVWPRIPFAASNLKTALTAVQANLGLVLVAYGFTAIAFGWSLFWFLGLANNLGSNNLAIVFLLFVSYYWTHQVLQNTMHVTTAGVVGTWWFVPMEASSFWSTALSDSLFRATTYSFGSICFGSLIVALIQALRALERYTRDNEDSQILSCIIQCILSCIESMMEYFNRWAYIYVGLYGFSYLEAGRNVVALFENKGWTAIITDDLAENVLSMMALAIGLATGLMGLVLASANPKMFQDYGMESSAGPGFLVGLLVGFLLSSIIMSIVGSAVNTVIVCYAEAPAEFQMNHPYLAGEMRAAWMQAWPGLVE